METLPQSSSGAPNSGSALGSGLVRTYPALRAAQRCAINVLCELPDPDVHLYMDSSDKGLCVLNPALREFIRVEFDATELILIKSGLFNINVREQFSALLAVLCWGQLWSVGNVSNLAHVRMWIDNSTAVAWCNKLASTNIFSQEMNRVFGAVEAEWGVRISAGHLAGSANYLADLGSRAWSNPMLAKWLNLTHTWTQVQVGPQSARKAYDGNWSPFNSAPSPTPPDGNTTRHGVNGQPSVTSSDVLHGYPKTTKSRSLSIGAVCH